MIPEMEGRSDAPESLHRTGYSSTDFGRKVDERGTEWREKGKEDRIGERLAEWRMVETQGRNDEYKG